MVYTCAKVPQIPTDIKVCRIFKVLLPNGTNESVDYYKIIIFEEKRQIYWNGTDSGGYGDRGTSLTKD